MFIFFPTGKSCFLSSLGFKGGKKKSFNNYYLCQKTTISCEKTSRWNRLLSKKRKEIPRKQAGSDSGRAGSSALDGDQAGCSHHTHHLSPAKAPHHHLCCWWLVEAAMQLTPEIQHTFGADLTHFHVTPPVNKQHSSPSMYAQRHTSMFAVFLSHEPHRINEEHSVLNRDGNYLTLKAQWRPWLSLTL